MGKKTVTKVKEGILDILPRPGHEYHLIERLMSQVGMHYVGRIDDIQGSCQVRLGLLATQNNSTWP